MPLVKVVALKPPNMSDALPLAKHNLQYYVFYYVNTLLIDLVTEYLLCNKNLNLPFFKLNFNLKFIINVICISRLFIKREYLSLQTLTFISLLW